MTTCQLLVLKDYKQIVAGSLRLANGKIVATPTPGYEVLCKNVLTSPAFLDDRHKHAITVQESPAQWLAALPNTYSGAYLRAQLMPSVAAVGTSDGAVKGWDTRGRKGKSSSILRNDLDRPPAAERLPKLAYYHGTSSALEASILKNGLIPGKDKGGDAWALDHGFKAEMKMYGISGRAAAVYLTKNIHEASMFEKLAMQEHPGSQGVVFKISVPAASAKNLEEDKFSLGTRYNGSIPPSWISVLGHSATTKEQFDLKHPGGYATASAATVLYAVILAKPDVQAYGTSDGTKKAWDTRGRGRKVDPATLQKMKFHPSGELKQGTAKSEPSDRMKRALANRVPCGMAKQKTADESEETISVAVGIPRTRNNSAFDLRNDKVGVEIKTFEDTKNGKCTMNKDALARKKAEGEKDGLHVYTVVADKRGDKVQYYYAPGVGSFRLGGMKAVSLAQLKGVLK